MDYYLFKMECCDAFVVTQLPPGMDSLDSKLHPWLGIWSASVRYLRYIGATEGGPHVVRGGVCVAAQTIEVYIVENSVELSPKSL